ncbi:MAG: ABC transporter ATP-binding protein [Rhodocyclaceae bacterium]|nr:ABC transporter ATP-binding protein [Rhodocyclaceae bacterium]MCA3025206.1 ABC transporter ATP-binding protein [Rhodocyclaceae bacterium]MCA3030301.1 ABC transporter ATP-binding protein [Rhodocyclaceae bacterium]MCA3036099.1 ABC transporter ATP-binding protein [Rhodocyclaceae bacterium]MCA3045417.1 ABC transporter ATP-binding protein [Rhodocyclaceae bacterium]
MLAVDDVSLKVDRGRLYGLIGADGAGKSSLMKMVAGVLAHDCGTVEVFGVRIDSERAAERVKARLGFMPQGLGLNLYPELSVEENIDFFARLRQVSAAELAPRKQQLLEMTRLAAFRTRAAKNLSGGMKQKLGLVCTLIHAPELIVLDEPTTGVDPVSRRDFWAILAQLIDGQRLTALVSTAYLDEASRFDRLALMHVGRVLAEGEPAELVAAAGLRVAQVQAEPAALARLAAHFAQTEQTVGAGRVVVTADDDESAVAAVRAALGSDEHPVPKIVITPPDLEDLFVARLQALDGTATIRPAPDADGRFERNRDQRSERADVEASVGTRNATPVPAPDHNGGTHAIDAQSLTRDFGGFRAVDRASFIVRYGEIFGLLGANGAGKTTAIKMLTGILPPSAGIGRVAGADMRQAGQAIKERIGYMSQAFSLYTDLTVMENLLLFAGVYGLTREQARSRAQWAVALGDLHGHEREPAGRLPMGLRQRLALGCALLHQPRVLFLDEPTSGVDPIGRRRFWDTLRRLAREQGVAILLTTHYMAEADLCDRIALMFAGRVVADATPAQLKAELTAERGQLLEVSAEPPLAALAALRAGGFAEAVLHGRCLHVLAHDAAEAGTRIGAALAAAGLAAPRITPQMLTMEDVFIHRVLALEAAAQARVAA